MTDNPPTGGGNGGPIGSTTRVAEKVVGALHGAPMLLVLATINVLMFGMVTYLILSSAEYRFKERTELMTIIGECIDELKKAKNPNSSPINLDKFRNMDVKSRGNDK